MKHSGGHKQGGSWANMSRITVAFIDDLLMSPSLSWSVKENPIRTQGPDVLSSDIYILHLTCLPFYRFYILTLLHLQTLNLCLPHLLFSLAKRIPTRSRNTKFLTVNSL